MRIMAAMIVVAACAVVAGCVSNEKGDRVNPPPTKELSGTLRSGYMGIGGEHTGWVLLVRSGVQGAREHQIEIDVSKVQAAARERDGQHVTAHGEYVEKRYVERGPTKIFVIERFE